MSTDFNWRTEDEHWRDEPVVQDTDEKTTRRWWPKALAVLLIVAAVSLLAYRQIRQQLDAAVAQTENDVRRTHELVLQAAGSQDRDLLTSVVSGRDEAWLNDLLELTDAGLLYNPVPFGLHAQNDADPQYSFDLSADLTEAVVTTTRTFTVRSLTGVSETVALKQYALYRQGQDRWLYSPPENPDAFWQGFETEEGDYLTITYPMRDIEQIRPLFQYLDTKLAEMCRLPDLSCPNNFRAYLKLETDPTVQIELLDMVEVLENAPPPDISLPTFTLVGIPVDESAKDALFRGYAAQVILVAMVNALDWDCCQRGLFFRALLDYQLSELGLSPYPMYPADYEQLFSRFQTIDQLAPLWRYRQVNLTGTNDWQWVYALTEFVLTTPIADSTAGAMQKSLLEADFYLSWLRELLSTNASTDQTVQQAWLNFIYAKSLSGQVAEGTYTPNQDILLQCENISNPRSDFYRYSWDENEWRLLDQFEDPIFYMTSTPDDSAVIVQRIDPQTTTASTFIWQDGEITPLLDSVLDGQNGHYFFGEISPDGRKLLMTKVGEFEGFSVLDLGDCDDAGCRLTAVSGRPVWSPSGRQMLLERLEPDGEFQAIAGLGRIAGGGQMIPLSDQGFAPFWLNEEEYGYLAFGQEPGLYTALVADDQPRLMLTGEDLRRAIPAAERPDQLTIQRATPNPANRNILAIDGFHIDLERAASYQFLWNRQTGEITFLGLLNQVIAAAGRWLPGGEWLGIPTFDSRVAAETGSALPWTYYLFHVSGKNRPVIITRDTAILNPALDYDINSEWLVIPKSGYLELVAMNQTVGHNLPYRRFLAHDFNRCRHALFIWQT